MKIVAAVFADFEQTALGLPSALQTELAGKSILQHTLRRLMQVSGLDERLLVIPAQQHDLAARFLSKANLAEQIRLFPIEPSFSRRWPLVGKGRWWGLNAWRGGVLGLTWFDEFIEPLAVAQIMQAEQSEGVLCLAGHMPALDVAIASAMLVYQRENADTAHMTFTMAPPGVAGVILRSQIVAELCEEQALVGVTCSYRPAAAQGDPINRPICFQIDPSISRTPVRLTGETAASRELLANMFAEHGQNATAEQSCAAARQQHAYDAQTLPTEITLEITTQHPLPSSTLRPPAETIEPHTLSDPAQLDTLVASLADSDACRLVLGGVGDPLQSSILAEVVAKVRPVVTALALETPLIELKDEHLSLFFESPIDVLLVQLDAHSAATYQAVHGADHFGQVVENIQRLVVERKSRSSPAPLIVPRLTRCSQTLAELEVFFDHWISQTGWAVIDGYRTWGGLRVKDALFPMTPPQQGACRRLAERLVLKADGTAWACDELVVGGIALGDWRTESLAAIWQGELRAALVDAHARGELSEFPSCQVCDQWHRP